MNNIDKEILLDCINSIYNYKFDKVLSYMLVTNSGSLLVDVSSYNEDLNMINKKTVEIYLDEYESFLRSKKINKLTS